MTLNEVIARNNYEDTYIYVHTTDGCVYSSNGRQLAAQMHEEADGYGSFERIQLGKLSVFDTAHLPDLFGFDSIDPHFWVM